MVVDLANLKAWLQADRARLQFLFQILADGIQRKTEFFQSDKHQLALHVDSTLKLCNMLLEDNANAIETRPTKLTGLTTLIEVLAANANSSSSILLGTMRVMDSVLAKVRLFSAIAVL